MLCPRASSHKVFQVDRLTDSVDRSVIPTAVKTNHCFGQSCSSAKANTSYFLKLKLCHWVMNHLHGEQRGGCWNFWSANMIGCLCLSAQWASTTEWRWQKKAPNYELPVVASCQKEKALNSRVAPRLPSANPNNVFNDRKKYSSELFCKSGISFEEGAGRVEMEC